MGALQLVTAIGQSVVALFPYLLGGLFAVFGVVSAVRSLREPVALDDPRSRLLLAVHDAGKALFWLSLGAFFVVYELADEPQDVRWLALIPVGMAALRLISAAFLGASERDRN